MSECIFCQVLSGELSSHKVWEDDQYLALLDIKPISPGHTLLIPKLHTSYIFDLDASRLSEIFIRGKHLSKPLKEATGAKRIGIMVEGFAVPHIHVHLVPINTGNDLDPRNALPATEVELTEISGKIREAVHNIR